MRFCRCWHMSGDRHCCGLKSRDETRSRSSRRILCVKLGARRNVRFALGLRVHDDFLRAKRAAKHARLHLLEAASIPSCDSCCGRAGGVFLSVLGFWLDVYTCTCLLLLRNGTGPRLQSRPREALDVYRGRGTCLLRIGTGPRLQSRLRASERRSGASR